MAKPLVLTIIDGLGIAPADENNAVSSAFTPNIDHFIKDYPAMSLYASGEQVGLMPGEQGNSVIGHLNIGGGRTYYEILPRIDNSIRNNSFFSREVFLKVIEDVKTRNSSLHLIGLISSSKLIASEDHCLALLKMAGKNNLKKVFVHVILDGEDTDEKSGIKTLNEFQIKMKQIGVGRIASVTGRNYAMSPDSYWERVEKTYHMLTTGESEITSTNFEKLVQEFYKNEIYDSWITPSVISRGEESITKIKDGDGLIFFNYRPYGMRGLLKAFALPGFSKFERNYLSDLSIGTMVEYEKNVPVNYAFSPKIIFNGLSEVVSKNNLNQVHIAETYGFSQITNYFNGNNEKPFENEKWELISSFVDSDFNDKPEMCSGAISKRVLHLIDKEETDFIVVNYSNIALVSASRNIESTKKAIEALDKQLGKIADHVLAKEGTFVLLSSFGRAENIDLELGAMVGNLNPVPFIIVNNEYKGYAGEAGDVIGGDLSLNHPVGSLRDVAPTVLKLLGIEKPEEMEGRSLI